MLYTDTLSTIKQYIAKLYQEHPLSPIIEALVQKGGIPYIVGGAVRDLFLGSTSKDIDIEVHNISLTILEEVLHTFGPVSLVGKSFGVIRLHQLDIDWSIPRKDSAGRHPKVTLNESLSIREAFERRDLTINAMGINLISYELVDPFNGLNDLKEKRLKTPNPARFIEDPLRFFRVMQFIARFEMHPDIELQTLCKTMDIAGVTKERIAAEFDKIILKSKKPSLAIRWLDQLDRLKEIAPEIAATKNVPQEPKWHPEGDVFEHIQQAFDAAALLEYDSVHERRCILWAALCHDLGKVTTTRYFDDAYRSHGHDEEGALIASKFLPRLIMDQEIIKTCVLLIRHHMAPGQFVKNKASAAAYKRLAHKLAPHATLEMLAKLFLSDKRATNPAKGSPLSFIPEAFTHFTQTAREANVLQQQEKPLLQGRDLLDIASAGPRLGELVQLAYRIQIEKGIEDKAALKDRLLEFLKSN